jgi:hypothetical protein
MPFKLFATKFLGDEGISKPVETADWTKPYCVAKLKLVVNAGVELFQRVPEATGAGSKC